MAELSTEPVTGLTATATGPSPTVMGEPVTVLVAGLITDTVPLPKLVTYMSCPGVDRHRVRSGADADVGGDGVGGRGDHRHRVAVEVGDVHVAAGDRVGRHPDRSGADADGG